MDEQEEQNHTHGSLCRQLGDTGRYCFVGVITLPLHDTLLISLLILSPYHISIPHSSFYSEAHYWFCHFILGFNKSPYPMVR
jgi:hypothetical protein